MPGITKTTSGSLKKNKKESLIPLKGLSKGYFRRISVEVSERIQGKLQKRVLGGVPEKTIQVQI